MPASNAANNYPDPTIVAIDWSGAENQAALAALIEYLKTL